VFIEADPAAAAGQGGAIGQLLVDHCILGPIRTRFGGSVETLTITDSVVQGLAATTGVTIFDPLLLADSILPAGTTLGSAMPAYPPAALLAAVPGLTAALQAWLGEPPASRYSSVPLALPAALAALISGPSIDQQSAFEGVNLSPETLALAALPAPSATQTPALNRALLEESFPVALGVAALAVAGATVQLGRVTVLGRIAAQRLSASDSILGGFVAVDDLQDGCVRFCAFTIGSAIPRQYESWPIPAAPAIFTSDAYGAPGYAQLVESADAEIIAGADEHASILSGAENGSEMGAFCSDLNPLKGQGLFTKYVEYLPLGLTPVIVHVT
jgi:hypothetical protein